MLTSVLRYALDTYTSNLSLMLLFSLSFVIAVAIPLFASLPAYSDAGAIFIRTASLYINLNPLNATVIIVAALFSLLFLSFAVVSINVLVKHSRTHTKIRQEVIKGLERHTGRVFLVLLLMTAVALAVSIIFGGTAYSPLIVALAELLMMPFVFYAPASIVIDESGIARALGRSAHYFRQRPGYVALWLVVAMALITAFDLLFIAIGGAYLSAYIMLVFDSLFILPFLVLLQSEMYMKRFRLLSR